MYLKKKVRQIRILPTSPNDKDFKTPELVENFFKNKLPETKKFHFNTVKIAEPEKTLTLFQYNNSIVACGIIQSIAETKEDGYEGWYEIDPTSIRFLSKPITSKELKDLNVEFDGFGKHSPRIKMKYFRDINNLLDEHFED